MSANIYEDPNLTLKVGYSKAAREAGGERLERVVDIYEGQDAGGRDWTCNGVTGAEWNQQRERKTRAGPQTGSLQQGFSLSGNVQRNLLGVAAVFLGLICLVMIVAVIQLSNLYTSVTLEKELLQRQIMEMKDETLRNQTKGWTLCYYISTERRNWTESRRDCLSRGADLVVINSKEEQSFIRHLNDTEAAWIGLRSVRNNQWEKKPEWKWVDGSEAEFQAWGTGVVTIAANDSAAFLGPEGGWNYTTDGSKHWICEKHI